MRQRGIVTGHEAAHNPTVERTDTALSSGAAAHLRALAVKELMVEPDNPVESGFRKALDQNGYSFQYAVLEFIQDAAGRGVPWWPVAPEFGVEVRGRDTRVDFILQHRSERMYMVCECKRANPATANWCFACAPWPYSGRYSSITHMPVVHRASDGQMTVALQEFLHTDRAFQIALEVRTGEKGDDKGAGRGEIEDAATQVCRGLNGLAEFFKEREDLLARGRSLTLVPAIFTTARLWASPTNVGTADVLTGKLPAGDMKLEEIGWLWLDYSQSRGVQHSIPHGGVPARLTDVFYTEMMRRIAVVNAGAIESFMLSMLWGH